VLQRRARRWVLARQLSRQGDWQGYADRFRTEVAVLKEAGDPSRAWTCAHAAALAEIALGRPQEAVKLMEPTVAAIRARGMARRCWMQVAMLAMAHIETGDAKPAARAIGDALPLMRVADGVWWLSDHFAWWLAQVGELADAARLHGWADARHAQRREPRSSHGRAARERLRARIDAALAQDEVAALAAAGARLLDDEAADIVSRAAERVLDGAG
jgi:hypothetical protein